MTCVGVGVGVGLGVFALAEQTEEYSNSFEATSVEFTTCVGLFHELQMVNRAKNEVVVCDVFSRQVAVDNDDQR